jgi:hypothetical protein
MSTTTAPDMALSSLLNLLEYEAAANALLPSPIFDFVAGSRGD